MTTVVASSPDVQLGYFPDCPFVRHGLSLIVGSVARASLSRSGHSLASATRCGHRARLAKTVTSICEILAVAERWQHGRLLRGIVGLSWNARSNSLYPLFG